MYARGLCRSHYSVAAYAGRLIDFERVQRSRDEVMTEWELLRSEGYTKRQAAERLRMTFGAFEAAYFRARRDGDPRAIPAIGAPTGGRPPCVTGVAA